jgi:hypothetical protein
MKRGTALARKTPLKAHTPMKRSPMRKRSRKSSPMRIAARGMPCLMNVAGVCNYNQETTVLAHFRWLGDCGTGIKPTDQQGAWSCAECNRWSDSPTPAESRDRLKYESDRNFYAARALVRMRILEAA